jgi:hypothetical protein
VLTKPLHARVLANLEEQIQLFCEERVVVFETETEKRIGIHKEPRPATISARPCEIRSRVANSWKTRTGSAALRTVTALVRRMLFVRVGRRAQNDDRCGIKEFGPMVFANAEHIQTDFVGEFHLFQQILHALNRAKGEPRTRVGDDRCEAIDTDLHVASP